MFSLLLALAIGAVVAVTALLIRRRNVIDVPTQKKFSAPAQIDRNDFDSPQSEWLIAVFTSESCHVCADMWSKAQVVKSSQVEVLEIEYTAARELHQKYNIDAVPTIVICDAQGVVQASFMGPVSATDLWAAVARVRDPEKNSPDITNNDSGECHG